MQASHDGPGAPGTAAPSDPIGDALAAHVADSRAKAARSRPRVQTRTGGGRHFLATCPDCGEETYMHLDPDGAVWCEDCGCVRWWDFFERSPGDVRAMRPSTDH